MKRPARGFTLIEMLVAAALAATLAMIALPLAELAVKRRQEAQLLEALRDIRNALDAYKQAADQGRIRRQADGSGYPPRLETLVEGEDDLASPRGGRIYFLRRLPRDPTYPDPNTPAARTWGLRSYDSPPDRPQPGRDVYDVHSLSTGVALDGTPYATW